MSQPIAIAVVAGLISGVMFLALLTGLPGMLVMYFAQLPLLFAGLTLGLGSSVLAVACAVAAIGLLASVAAAFGYFSLQALPALFVIRQVLLQRTEDGRVEWFPAGLLLAQLTLLAAAGVVVAFLLFGAEPGGLPGAIEAGLGAALVQFGLLAEGAAPPASLAQVAAVLPGFTASSAVLMAVINLLLAQMLAVRAGRNRRPSPDLDRLELPEWAWPGIAVAAVLALFGGAIGALGWSLLIVLVLPYVFLGLAVIHAMVRRWSHPGLVLVGLYGSIVLLGWPILGVLALGLVEDWAHLRRRWQ